MDHEPWMDDEDMFMIIVGDVDANDEQAVETKPTMPIPIKEEQEEWDRSKCDPESILETAELHGQYVTFTKKEDQSIQEEHFEYDYLEDSRKENGTFETSSEEEDITADIQLKPRQSYIEQLRKNFPKMRKDEEYLVAHLTEMMKQTKPPMPPIGFCQNVDNMLECAYCDVKTFTLAVACRHYQKKHGKRYLTCYACGCTYRCTTGLYKHEKRCRSAGAALVLRARGRYLGRKGRKRPFLTRHKFDPWGDHNKKQPKQRFFCSECTANFHNKAALLSHELMHRGERPYQCDQCPVAYTSSTALKRHLQTHSDSEYICDVCERSFKVKTSLIVHMNTHLPQRKFPCDRCERRFAQKHALQHHINRDHLKIPPAFPCPACPKRFPRVSNLNTHMKAKHGLTVMTRKMFFKALPSMKETELKKATVVFKQNDDNVLAIDSITESNSSDDKGSNKKEIKIDAKLVRKPLNKQFNRMKQKKQNMDSNTVQDMITEDGEMFAGSDDQVQEVIVNTNDLFEKVPKKAAIKTSLNSCELEFAISKRKSPETKIQSRIPRVDLSFARGPKQNRGPKSDLTKNQNPKIGINVARMHEQIKETCGKNMPDLTVKTEVIEINDEAFNINTEVIEVNDEAMVLKDTNLVKADLMKNNNLTVTITRGSKAFKTAIYL